MPRCRSAVALCAGVLCCTASLAAAAPELDRAALMERARKAGRAYAEALTGAPAVPSEPYSSYRARPKELGITRYEELTLPVDGGIELRAWFVPAKTGGKPKGTVIVLHGWGSNVGFALQQSAFLLDRGYQLYLLDARTNSFVGNDGKYRGFLREDLADVSRAIEAVRRRPDVDPDRVALYGFSWGGTKALLAGAEHPELRAVIADAASILDAGGSVGAFEDKMPPSARKDLGLFGEFLFAQVNEMTRLLGYAAVFDVVGAAARIAPRPLLIIHSRDDRMVPFYSAEVIAKVATPTKVLFGDKFGHCLGMRNSPDEYIAPVVAFLDASMK
ncbi:MAG TPA: alpha/beta fold hydrolase [Myxococcaceae bacterium]|nr:alpha/beta fold hydrolase [Myxococcaceae bacterium]